MWTVLKKELREGWLFLLINILWLAGVPPLMRLCIPDKWDADVTVIFYACMFGVFVPLYLVILAAGLVQDENTFLVRGLPVKPWKVAGGKLLYLALNYFIMEGLCVPFVMGPMALPEWIESDVMFIYLWVAATGVASLTAFAFASVLPRKSYAIFAALLATILGMGSLMYLYSFYSAAIAADLAVKLLLYAALVFLLAGGFVLYHDLIRQSRRRWARAAAVGLLLPAAAGVLWLRAPLWMKQVMVSNPYDLLPAGDNLFLVANRWDYRLEPYLFDVRSGELMPFLFLGRTEHIVGTDAAKRVVYTAADKPIARDGKTYFKYSAIDPDTGKTRDLGLLPKGWKHFRGDIVDWQWGNDDQGLFGFKNLVTGKVFEFKMEKSTNPIWGREGVLFQTAGPEGAVWRFVDYATATPRDAFKGDYYRWPWTQNEDFFLFEGKRDADNKIPYDRDCFQWNPKSGNLQKLGPGRPLYLQDETVVLIRGAEDKPKRLALYKNGRETATLDTNFLGGYPLVLDVGFPFDSRQAGNDSRIVFWTDKERTKKSLGLLKLSEGSITMQNLPLSDDLYASLPIYGSDEILLFMREGSRKRVGEESISRVYRFNPATGRKKRIV